jgi:hypothetical protein
MDGWRHGFCDVTLAIVTPSYAPDFESFCLLHRSVVTFSDPSVIHYAVVPDEDEALFATLRSSRLRIVRYREVLPRSFVSTAWFAHAVAKIPGLPRGARFVALNLRYPWPPLRGWLVQQIVKLRFATSVDADVLLLVDSDVQLIRPIVASMFLDGSCVRTYRKPAGITAEMTRHVRWHQTARRLLGVLPDGDPPYDDAVGSFISWDPRIVQRAVERVREVTGQPWETAIAREWDFSEYVFMGEYIREFVGPDKLSFTFDRTLCHSYWSSTPLTLDAARAFVERLSPDDVAIHVQSISHTSADILAYIRGALPHAR